MGDCSKPDQLSKYPGWKSNFFCSRGHLTPYGDFKDNWERDLTMVMTNIAPQWQEFNGGNWMAVEQAVTDYVDKIKNDLYVFTGTGKFITRPYSYLHSSSPCDYFKLP